MREVEIAFDGSIGPENPGGYACYGYVIKEGDKVVLQKGGIECQGEGATNNVAEHSALYHALAAALAIYGEDAGDVKLNIKGDSKLVINQVNGTWKCNADNLKSYVTESRKLLAEFHMHSMLYHVKRDFNTDADELSKYQNWVHPCGMCDGAKCGTCNYTGFKTEDKEKC